MNERERQIRIMSGKSIVRKELNPLLVIRSPRDTEEVEKCYHAMDFIDKLWVKYYTNVEMHRVVRRFVEDHPEYTHIILTSDDVYPTVEHMKMLLEDLEDYDYPAISGCCNHCEIFNAYHQDKRNVICSFCEDKKEHEIINVTIKPVDYFRDGKRRHHSSDNVPCPYDHLTTQYQKENERIIRCWYQGFALGAIRRDVFDAIGCRAYTPIIEREDFDARKYSIQSDDTAFAVDCAELDIPQYSDLRIFMRHDGRSRRYLQVGVKEPKLIFEKATRKLFEGLYGKFSFPIMICSPFDDGNKETIPKYFESLINLDYPKELIDLVWFDNNVSGSTRNLIEKCASEIRNMGYHSFNLVDKQSFFKKGNLSSDSLVWVYLKNLNSELHRFVMMFLPDVIAPSECVVRFIRDFNKYHNAGWIGGVSHRVYPFLDVESPLMLGSQEGGRYRHMTDEEILSLQMSGHSIFECGIVSHVWMMKREYSTNISKVFEKGYKIYCDSGIYLTRISLDGKVYRHGLSMKNIPLSGSSREAGAVVQQQSQQEDPQKPKRESNVQAHPHP